MLLSIRYRFLFVHIPKTGGTSIRAALRYYKWSDPYRIPLFLCSRLSAFTGHRLACKLPRHAKIIAAHEMLPRDFFDSLFKFAFVRNPWDRAVSFYNYYLNINQSLVRYSFKRFLFDKLSKSLWKKYSKHFLTFCEFSAI